MTWIDILINVAFIVYCLYAGLRSRTQASKNLEEYFLAGRTLPGWMSGLSMAATQFAADTPLLVVGLIATAGIFSLWQLWIYALAFLLLGFLLAPQWRRSRVITDAEFTELRYGNRPAAALRLVKAFYFGTIFNCIGLAWVLFAAAKIAEPFLLWDVWLPASVFQPIVDLAHWIHVPITNLPPSHPHVWAKTASNLISMVVIVAVTTTYSMLGGLRSVVWTDVGQFSLMMLATFIFSLTVVSHAGGLERIHAAITEAFSSNPATNLKTEEILSFTPWHAKDASFAVIAVFALQWILQIGSDGSGYLAQRAMSCRTDTDSKIAGLVFTVTQVLFRSLLWIPLGLGLLVIYPFDPTLPQELQASARESTYVQGIAQLLPPGAKGIMIAAMLAALASTLDTHLNWGASYWTNDIYKRFICQVWLKREPNERSLVWIARASNVMILALASVVMTRFRSIQEAWQISLLLGAGIGPVLLLRWIWWRINAWSEITAIVVSAVSAPLLLSFVDNQPLRLLLAGSFSLIGSLVAAYIHGPESWDVLERFYERVQPAGFWGPIAGTRRSSDIKKLVRALGATFISSFSLFCLLVGFGSWLARSPVPPWFPLPDGAWAPLNILVGIAIIPIWIRLGFHKDEFKALRR